MQIGLRYPVNRYLGSNDFIRSNSQRLRYLTVSCSRFFHSAASISTSQPSSPLVTILSMMFCLNPNWKSISTPKWSRILLSRFLPMIVEYIRLLLICVQSPSVIVRSAMEYFRKKRGTAPAYDIAGVVPYLRINSEFEVFCSSKYFLE